MKTIDLAAAENALKELMEEFGIEANTFKLAVHLWRFKPGVRELSIQISVFNKSRDCVTAESADWQTAIELMRAKLMPEAENLGDEGVSVVASAGET